MIGKESALITALLFGFVVIKVVWIARGDIPTALGVFDSAGLAMVVVGGFLSAFPLISAIVLGLAMFELSKTCNRKKTFPFIKLSDRPVGVIAVVAAVGCFFLAPWPIMAFSTLIGPGMGFLSRKKKPLRQAAVGFCCWHHSFDLESPPLRCMASSRGLDFSEAWPAANGGLCPK
jgi:hypothetical protein